MRGILENIKIQGVSVAVPEWTLDNSEYVTLLGERRLKKQVRLTGVKKRHIALRRQTTADLCMAASRKLVNHLNWEFSDIKVLVFVTQSPSFGIPSTAFYIQNKLGISTDCVCFDINLGCSSVDNGVQVVGSLMKTLPEGAKGLLLVGDTSGKPLPRGYNMDPDVVADGILFGSAGAAFAFENVANENIYFQNESDGSGYQAIIRYIGTANTQMDGEKVFEFATTKVPNSMKNFMSGFKLSDSDVDYYIFHQAQNLILDMIAAECGIPEEKELRTVEDYGNTSGTSVAVSICAHKEDIPSDRDVAFALTGFGIGLSWGTIYAKIPGANILPVIETNEYDEECFKKIEKIMWKKTIVFWGADKNQEVSRYLAQDLDIDTARVILCGENREVLEKIADTLDFSNYVATSVGELEDILTNLDTKLKGIVAFTEGQLEFIEQLIEKEQVDKSCSIVLLSKEEGTVEKYGIPCHKIVYDTNSLELTELSDGGVAWTKKVLSGEDMSDAKRTLALKDTVRFALSQASTYLDNVTYRLNDM